MKVFTSLVLVATLAAAVPEPAKTTKSLCSKLAKPRCHDPAISYCSKHLTTTTTIGGGATQVTAFPTNYPCLNSANGKAKRELAERQDSGKTPVCLRKIESSGGEEAVTSACACLGIYPSTATESSGSAQTVFARSFVMRSDAGGTDPYAFEAVVDDVPNYTITQFKSSLRNAGIFSLNQQCNLLDNRGNMAFTNASKTPDAVVWIPTGPDPIYSERVECGLSGVNLDNLQCAGSGIFNEYISSLNGGWGLTFDSDQSLFNIYFTPVAD